MEEILLLGVLGSGIFGSIAMFLIIRKTLDFDFKVHLKSILSVASSNLGFGYLVT